MSTQPKSVQQGGHTKSEKSLSVESIPTRKLTYRQARVVRALVEGTKTKGDILRDCGFPESLALSPSKIITPELQAECDRIQAALVEYQLDHALIDATEILEQLTDEARGDLADLYDDQGEPLPIKQWPLWARLGGVEFVDEPNMVPSGDGEGKSWDQVGRKIRIIGKPRTKTRELAMKHKGVNAMVEAKSPDLHVHLHAEITEKLQGAMARKERIIEAETLALDVPNNVIST